MNEFEVQRIAAAMNHLRPDWPVASLRTLITEKLGERARRDVAVALAWVACESNTATPARVLEAGPWWKAAAVDGGAHHREPYDRGGTCSTCTLPHAKCRQVWGGDHQYVSVHEYEKTINRDPERIKRIIEAAKAEVTPQREPSKPKAAAITERDHSECDTAINEAIARGNKGMAEFLSERCDREHALTARTHGDPESEDR